MIITFVPQSQGILFTLGMMIGVTISVTGNYQRVFQAKLDASSRSFSDQTQDARCLVGQKFHLIHNFHELRKEIIVLHKKRCTIKIPDDQV